MHRTKRGKRFELTPRDIEIFKLMRRYRYLRSSYIHAFVGGACEKRLKERLGHLYHEGYLARPDQQWRFANARYSPAVYECDAGAARILRELDIAINEQRTFLTATAHRQFQHSLMICEVLASIDLAIRDNSRLRFIAWPEILARAPEQTRQSPMPFRIPLPSGKYLIPDGLFGIEYEMGGQKAYRFFALEIDRGTMPLVRSNQNQTSYLGKLAAYREAISKQLYKAHLGVPNLLVLTVTISEARATDIIARLVDHAGGSAVFSFKAVDATDLRAPATRLLFEPWERAGCPPLQIDG